MRQEMTRYSQHPTKTNRKNTLFTLRDGDVIFFGIARCNKDEGDKFTKSKGQMIAKTRAIKAKVEADGSRNVLYDCLVTRRNGLSGSVHVDNIRELLQYFEHIDEIMYEDGKK